MLTAFLLPGCGSSPPEIKTRKVQEYPSPGIRVCLLEKKGEIDLATMGQIWVIQPGKTTPLARSSSLHIALGAGNRLEITVSTGLVLGGREKLALFADENSAIILAGNHYRDTVFIHAQGGKLFLINHLPLEKYVAGVLVNEIGPGRPIAERAAVEAQAILARTYGLRKTLQPLRRLFDVYSDTRDQVYSGTTELGDLYRDAIAITSGQVLTLEGTPAECYYHSSCGGHTENIASAWSRASVRPHLAGISDSIEDKPWCAIAPKFKWTHEVSRKEFEDILRSITTLAGQDAHARFIAGSGWYVLDVTTYGHSSSGRVTSLEILVGNRSQQGRFSLPSSELRKRIGGLRSTLFTVRKERGADNWISRIVFEGRGFGHGIGLCQWGAIARARSGWSTEAILRTYFPGTAISILTPGQ